MNCRKRLSRRQAVTYVSTFDMPRSLRTLKTGVQFSLSFLKRIIPRALHWIFLWPYTTYTVHGRSFSFATSYFSSCARERPFPIATPLHLHFCLPSRRTQDKIKSNLYITVTLGKWPGDRYVQGYRCTQVSFKLPWKSINSLFVEIITQFTFYWQ